MTASDFLKAYQDRHKLAEGWKQAGKKVFGYFCNYTPEEIIYAAGIVPVRIRGTTENIDYADTHMPSFCCSYMRGALDQALKGRYRYLDGMVFPKTCDMTRALYGIWKRNVPLPYYRFLALPGKSTAEAVDFYTKELELFVDSLQKFTGKTVDNDALRNAITVYNENRSLMNRVYELGRGHSSPFKGSEIFVMAVSGVVLPKDEHNRMLRELLRDLPDRSDRTGTRLLLMGNNFESIEIVRAIEQGGGEIVVDDIDTGTRYYESKVKEDGEPLRAIAERYLQRIICPCKHAADERLERILDLARAYHVKGVVMVVQKYCDTHLYDRPWLEGRLKEEGFPVLSVDHSDIGWSGGKFKTMVQAFLEMLE